MIPGTAKEAAALAMIRMKAAIGYASADEISSYEGALKLAERRELVAAGNLPDSSRHAHAVPLGVDLVKLAGEPIEGMGFYGFDYWLRLDVEQAVFAAVIGLWELWFSENGDAFLSIEHEGDAVLFRLALDA